MPAPTLKLLPGSTDIDLNSDVPDARDKPARGKRSKKDSLPTGVELTLHDVGNGRRILERNGDILRYHYERGSWYVWDGRRFAQDMDGCAFRLATQSAEALYHDRASMDLQLDDRIKVSRWALASQSVARINSALEAASNQITSRGFTIRVGNKDLDRNPMLLNLLNGTYDLEAGVLRSHDPADALTKLAPVVYDANTDCPMWERFIGQTFVWDKDLIRHVQKLVGYSMSGATSEQILVILNGDGSNGKGVLTGVIAHLLGDYAKSLSVRSLTTAASNDIRSDLASLPGSRFVAASEGNEGEKFDEALVKLLTGEDQIRARFLYQNEFEFTMTGKVWLQTNHLPRITGGDWAIWRRLRVIPFNQTIRDTADAPGDGPIRDPKLKDKLIATEASGILNWCLEGARLWQEEGLGACEAIESASASYRAREDTIKGFMDARCTIRSDVEVGCTELYESYKDWCSAEGFTPRTQTGFGSVMGARFPMKRNSKGQRVRAGIELKLDFRS